MKNVLTGFAVLVVAISIYARAQQSSDVEQQITAMERTWADAVRTNQADVVAPMVADKYVNMSTNGSLSDKAKTLDNIRKNKWQAAELSDIKVTSYGNTAIATGGWHGKGVSSDGSPIDVHEHWMDTWIKTPEGKWQCIATASSPVK